MHYDTNHPHFLQSAAWRSFHQSLNHHVIANSGDDWSYLAIVEQTLGIKRLYCPYGPTVQSISALESAIADLRQAAHLLGISYLRLQPIGIELTAEQQASQGLLPIAYSQPSATSILDLTKSTDELLAGMKQNTRNVVRNYHKKGLSYRTSQDPADIKHLLRLLHQMAQHNQISIHSDSYLTHQATSLLPIGAAKLHFIDYQSATVAAALTYQDDSTVYYAHAAADHEHRKLNPSTALVGEIMLSAKASGQRYFDLFGITTSDDPSHKWAGFTRFKQSFGGQTVSLSATYEIPVRPLTYRIYTTLRHLRP